MEIKDAAIGPIRLTTEDIPEHERIPLWRDFYGPSLLRLEIEPGRDAPFHAEVTAHQLPGIRVVSSRLSACRISRARTLLADGNDDIALLATSSASRVSQGRMDVQLGAGDLVALSNAEPGAHTSPFSGEHFCLHVQRARLEPLVANLDDALLRVSPRGNPSVRYLFSYIRFLLDGRRHHQSLAPAAAIHIGDLVALVLGATHDGMVLAERRGLLAARFQSVKADIIRNIARPGLCVGQMAARHNMTLRHLQRLFAAESTTFSRFVLEQRLFRAQQLLSDVRRANWPVSAIAFEAGFGDISYFNRCFRRRYGASPREFRHNRTKDASGLANRMTAVQLEPSGGPCDGSGTDTWR